MPTEGLGLEGEEGGLVGRMGGEKVKGTMHFAHMSSNTGFRGVGGPQVEEMAFEIGFWGSGVLGGGKRRRERASIERQGGSGCKGIMWYAFMSSNTAFRGFGGPRVGFMIRVWGGGRGAGRMRLKGTCVILI